MVSKKLRNGVLAATILSSTVGLSATTWAASVITGPPSGPPTPPPVVTTPPPVVNTPPPTPTPTPTPPVVTIPTIPNTDVLPLMPVDVTHTTDFMNSLGPRPDEPDALAGLTESKSFPSASNLKGPSDFILVLKEKEDDQFSRDSPYTVTLTQGTVLASVRRPSQTGYIHTALADVAFSANSDAFVSVADGATRIRNVDGMGQALKVRINSGPGTGVAISIAPGYELVVADHKLSRADLKPNDGILRRGVHVLEGGQAAVSEYHVESALQSSALVQNLANKPDADAKQKRVVGDMTRMAAVLNQINGSATAYNR